MSMTDLMNPSAGIALGTTRQMTVVVAPEMTISHFVDGMPQVYSTPIMILHMEMAAGDAIQPLLPKGFVSVGIAVDVRHLAATPIGRAVRIEAHVVQIEGNKVLFAVEAWNGDRKIGGGTHRRAIVNRDEFEARLGIRAGT